MKRLEGAAIQCKFNRDHRTNCCAIRKSLFALSIILCFLSSAFCLNVQQAFAGKKEETPPGPPIPAQFLPLYKELHKTLIDARHHYGFNEKGPRPHISPAIFMAGSFFHACDSDSERWHDLIDTIDAFKDMGCDTVSVMISLPDLCSDDPAPMVEFYQRLASEIHSRNMKLYIEHFISPPSSKNAIQGSSEDWEAKKQFLIMLQREITLVYRKIKPDYLTVVSEPETLMRWSHFSFTPTELGNWVGRLCKDLKEGAENQSTLLGAGAGTWESEDFVVKFAEQEALDYIDFHLYPLKVGEQNSVANLALLIQVVREVRPKIMVTIGETWLYKHGAEEPGGVFDKQSYQRDNYSFWKPLDEQFLRLVLAVAQKENVAVVSPYFSQFFFTTYTFGDEDAKQLPSWPQSLVVSWKKAMESVRAHKLSPLGETMKNLLSGSGNTNQ